MRTIVVFFKGNDLAKKSFFCSLSQIFNFTILPKYVRYEVCLHVFGIEPAYSCCVLEEKQPRCSFIRRSGLGSSLFGTAALLVTVSVCQVPVYVALKCLFTSASSLEFISGVYCCLIKDGPHIYGCVAASALWMMQVLDAAKRLIILT